MDYEEFLRGVDRLGPNTPLMLEHLSTPLDYDQAAAFVRSTAERASLTIR